MEIIKAEQITKRFGAKLVFEQLEFSVQEGLIYGVLGANGAGKTTLFNCITGLDLDYEGTIVRNLERHQIGYVPSHLFFYDNIKAEEHIEFCLALKKVPYSKEEVKKWNQLFQLPLEDYAHNYSTGMQKRLALMTVFLQKNIFFVLDEPFNGLDLEGCLLLKRIILDQQKKNKTFLISSHIISTLTDSSDSIFELTNKGIKLLGREDFSTIEERFNQCLPKQL